MARIAPLKLGKDINGNVTYFIPPPSSTAQSFQFRITTPGTPVSVTVPDWAKAVRFAADAGASIWVNMFGTAQVPATAAVTGDTSELNPIGRTLVEDISTISIDSDAVCNVNVVFYEDPQGAAPYVL